MSCKYASRPAIYTSGACAAMASASCSFLTGSFRRERDAARREAVAATRAAGSGAEAARGAAQRQRDDAASLRAVVQRLQVIQGVA